MKKILIYTVLLMLFGFATAYSQSSLPKATENEKQSTLPADPKLSPEENALRLNAGEDNPAKIDVQLPIDPKMNTKTLPTEDDYGQANANSVEVEPDPKLLELKSGNKVAPVNEPVVRTAGSNTQPPGEQAGTITDYRNQQAGSSEQAPGEPAKNITDYRASSGSNTQPEGDQPSK